MALLTGLTEGGAEIPVQVGTDGRLVAEGLQGLPGPAGAQGLKGDPGPAGDSSWNRTGTEISPKTAGDSVFASGDVKVGGTTAAPAAKLAANGDITGKAITVIGDAHTTHSAVRDLKGATTTRYGFQLANSQADSQGTLDLMSTAAAVTSLTAFSIRKGGETRFRIAVDGSTQWGIGGDLGQLTTTRAAVDPNTGNATFLGELKIGGAAGAPNITFSAAGNIRALGVVSRIHADNAAAKAAGLVAGDIYRTATGQLMIAFSSPNQAFS
jgi:hypothetical protein